MRARAKTCLEAIAGALLLALATMMYRSPHTLLPPGPRLFSPGMLAIATTSLVLMLVRSVGLLGGSAAPALLSWALVLGAIILFAGTRFPAFAALILAASIGVDTISIVLSLLGLADIASSQARQLLAVWEISAAGLACIRFNQPAPAEQH